MPVPKFNETESTLSKLRKFKTALSNPADLKDLNNMFLQASELAGETHTGFAKQFAELYEKAVNENANIKRELTDLYEKGPQESFLDQVLRGAIKSSPTVTPVAEQTHKHPNKSMRSTNAKVNFAMQRQTAPATRPVIDDKKVYVQDKPADKFVSTRKKVHMGNAINPRFETKEKAVELEAQVVEPSTQPQPIKQSAPGIAIAENITEEESKAAPVNRTKSKVRKERQSHSLKKGGVEKDLKLMQKQHEHSVNVVAEMAEVAGKKAEAIRGNKDELSHNKEKLNNLTKEIIYTEKNLTQSINHFYKVMALLKKSLPDVEASRLESILKGYKGLAETVTPDTYPQLFSPDKFKQHSENLRQAGLNQLQMDQLLQEIKVLFPNEYKQMLDNLQKPPYVGKQPGDFTIMPTQRSMRYVLLLNEVVPTSIVVQDVNANDNKKFLVQANDEAAKYNSYSPKMKNNELMKLMEMVLQHLVELKNNAEFKPYQAKIEQAISGIRGVTYDSDDHDKSEKLQQIASALVRLNTASDKRFVKAIANIENTIMASDFVEVRPHIPRKPEEGSNKSTIDAYRKSKAEYKHNLPLADKKARVTYEEAKREATLHLRSEQDSSRKHTARNAEEISYPLPKDKQSQSDFVSSRTEDTSTLTDSAPSTPRKN